MAQSKFTLSETRWGIRCGRGKMPIETESTFGEARSEF
jgi:hypothetical protein